MRGRLIRYGAVGLAGNLLGYLFFLILLATGLPAVMATGLTYLIVLAASYFANRRWTFGNGTSHARDVPRFLLAHSVGFLVSIGAMHVLSAGLHPALAQIAVIGIAAATIYTVLELVKFGQKEDQDD